jgi:hypothetical protein
MNLPAGLAPGFKNVFLVGMGLPDATPPHDDSARTATATTTTTHLTRRLVAMALLAQ